MAPKNSQLFGRNLLAPIVLISLSLCPLTYQQQQQQLQNATSTQNSYQSLSTILAQNSIETTHSTNQDDSLTATTLSSSLLKTYIRTNNMRAYHLDLHSYRQGAKYVGDPAFVDSENPKHKLRCADHLNKFKHLLESFNELDPVLDNNSRESIHLADSFGRPESGAMSGNQFWLGDYESCLDFQHKPNKEAIEPIKSQYCLGVTQYPNWNPQDSKTSIKVGLCLPETCTSSIINENSDLLSTVETMMKSQFGLSKPFSRLVLREIYCLPHETSEIRQYTKSSILFLIFVGSFVSLSFVATTIDYLSSKSEETIKTPCERTWRTIVIESFSLTRNLDKFLHIREDTPQSLVEREEGSFDRQIFLNSTTGLKCIGLFWIVCAHTFLVSPISSKNLIYLDKLTKTYLADIYLTAHLMVDTFFGLSGLLCSYFLFKGGMQNIKTSKWFVLTLHRYWRLTPIYLICYWFTKSVGFLLNTGPMWDYMTAEQSPRLNCARESWSEAILHLSDFKSPKDHCVPFAWFIANGIKFWMVTPIFLILIHKSIRRGYMVTISTIFASMALVGTLAFRSSVDMKAVIEFKPESADNMLNNMGEIYTRPYSRIGAYLVGLLAGHLMYLIDTNQIEVKLSKNAKIAIWTLFSVTVIVLTFILKIANGIQLDGSSLIWVFSISSAVIRPLWAVCSCWLVFALAHGEARWASRFLSANFWRLLVKLSFCAYLSQGEVMAQLYLSPTNAYAFSYTDMIAKPIVAIVLTVLVSSLMVLFLEYPLIGIEELILPVHTKDSPPKSNVEAKTQGEKHKSA